MNTEVIRFIIHTNFVNGRDFGKSVERSFDEVMKILDMEIQSSPPKSLPEFVARFEDTSQMWHDAAVDFTSILLSLGSREVVAVDCFKPLLRNRSPRFYFSLLMQGMKPLDDECSEILKMKAKYDAKRGVSNG